MALLDQSLTTQTQTAKRNALASLLSEGTPYLGRAHDVERRRQHLLGLERVERARAHLRQHATVDAERAGDLRAHTQVMARGSHFCEVIYFDIPTNDYCTERRSKAMYTHRSERHRNQKQQTAYANGAM